MMMMMKMVQLSNYAVFRTAVVLKAGALLSYFCTAGGRLFQCFDWGGRDGCGNDGDDGDDGDDVEVDGGDDDHDNDDAGRGNLFNLLSMDESINML